MATDNLISALINQRSLGDWSQPYRPLFNPITAPAERATALSQVLRGIAAGGIYSGGGERRQPGYDPNQGAGVSNLGFWEGLKTYGPNALAVLGGPVGMGLFAARKGVGMFLNNRARGREAAFAGSLQGRENTRQTQAQVNAMAAAEREARRRAAGGGDRSGMGADGFGGADPNDGFGPSF